ncbi:MAG: EamA family transporter RarD [Propionivibrio sp.]
MSSPFRSPSRSPTPDSGAGLAYALLAFVMWGLFPLYFHALSAVPSIEVLAHRVIWSALLLAGWAAWRGRLGPILEEFGKPRRMGFYALTTLLISANWWIFIWAIQNGRVLEGSLGYYINPLVNVLLGVVFLHERLNPRQWLAIAIAAGAVLWLVAAKGVVPWVSLSLALSFGSYGLIRKMAGFDAMLGLTIETLLLAPLALAGMAWWMATGQASMGQQGLTTDLLLLAAGAVTVAPLLCFLEAGLRLKLATLGIVQYITPTMQFLLGVFVFHEHFDHERGVTFVLIWLALVIYTLDALRQHRLRPNAPEAE